MSKELARIEQFIKKMDKEDGFITGVMNTIYDHIDDPTTQEIIECTGAIVCSNLNYLDRKIAHIDALKKTMANSAPIVASPIVQEVAKESSPKDKKEHRDLSELIRLVRFNYLEDETIALIEQQSHNDIIRIKLHFYKLMLDTKRKIKEMVLGNPFADIRELQFDLDSYTLILESISELEKKDKIEEAQTELEFSNIFLATNRNGSTYIFEDIAEYPEKSKEIKNIFEKLIDGYFLKTKDTKGIEGYQENLYEYKHPNGIRILYVVIGNIIVICSLFMKDKKKSTRIANEYDEAIKRFYDVKDYIMANFNNPEFHIEQAEQVGKIFQLLDGPSLSKKVGDD